jgi:hypothetical protein
MLLVDTNVLLSAADTSDHGRAEVGSNMLALLRSVQSLIDAVRASLLNDLDAVPDGVVLVLDD